MLVMFHEKSMESLMKAFFEEASSAAFTVYLLFATFCIFLQETEMRISADPVPRARATHT